MMGATCAYFDLKPGPTSRADLVILSGTSWFSCNVNIGLFTTVYYRMCECVFVCGYLGYQGTAQELGKLVVSVCE